ncbi:hypothetical protein [Demequina flava]|uniref:hypothetical protein n=1 Tax=Demequina flava TaxID=1095025 RepID=UPI00128B517A|nr:hypothetical protein [Demequina flava]
MKAAQVRDARFARIISTGRHSGDDGASTYIVSERPRGVRGDQLLGASEGDPEVVGALVGDAARALEAIRALGVSHGALNASSLVVSPAGRVIIVGLGVEGPLAVQDGHIEAVTPEADAAALSEMYLTGVTGRPAKEATAADIPLSLGTGTTALAHAVVAGDAPARLSQITTAIGPSQPRALRRASARATTPPSSDTAATPVSAASTATVPTPASVEEAGGDLAPASAPVVQENPPELVSADQISVSPLTAVAAAQAADKAIAHARLVGTAQPLAIPVPEPDRPPDPKLEPLRAWDTIVEAQNAKPAPSFVESVLGGLRKLAPKNEALQSAHVKAHARAHRTAPLNVGPLLLALTILAVIIVVVVSWEEVLSPFQPDFDLNNNPQNSYPTYTYSPEPYPTASPSPSE